MLHIQCRIFVDLPKMTIIAFSAYLYYNVKHADDEDKEDFINEVKKQAIESRIHCNRVCHRLILLFTRIRYY